MSDKKPASPSKTSKKATSKTAKPTPSHPTWVDMIKECITAHPEDARQGVSRPQIKKFVETKYKLSIGTAQNTQLSKALATGSEKNFFVLPKGPSGRVKLAPKAKSADASATKENKPTKAKPKTTKTAPAKATTTKKAPTKSTTRPAQKKPTVSKKKTTTAKPKPSTTTVKKAAPAKKLAGKAKPTATKKTATASKRAPAKKAATRTTATAKAKSAKATPKKKAATQAPVSKTKVPRKSVGISVVFVDVLSDLIAQPTKRG
ncbi:hypothetical protein GGX14DRAFT_695373 [Mycena pura]|uniref:Histone H1 n=1 Tax=Mycena pura TaxID=153505 RepID=A0AAD6YJH4_9AGAR|nr:hypothetical protein GGX14DRAFT_695373 [Mycena pura]